MVSRLRPGDPTYVGRYEVLSRIGGGGMGMVYLAEGPRGTVALKLVRPELGDDPHFRARFRREVQASFRVSGVCTVRLLDFDTEAEQPWMATEYVDGPSLTELIEAAGPLPAAKQLALAVGLAEGLKSIHDEDVVHRDLKPSNVLCALTGPKVIDFGIAAAADAAPLTRSGLMVGSPGWLSPEQITTGRASAASDVFALGCVLIYAASGEQPYGTGTAEALFYRVLNQGPNIDYEKLHPALHEIVREAIAPEPGQRPSARAILDALLEAGAVSGDVRGSTGSSVTSVLQRDWSLPSGLQVAGGAQPHPSNGSGSWSGAGVGAGASGASYAGGGTEVGAGALNFSKAPSSAPPSAPPPSFAPPGPWTPAPAQQTRHPQATPPPQQTPQQSQYAQQSQPAYTPPPAQPGYPGTTPPSYGPPGGFGPLPAAGPPGGGRKPWLIPALVGGGVLVLVAILIAVLVAGSGGGSKPGPPVASPPATKDPSRIRTGTEVDALVKASRLLASDVPGSNLTDQSAPAGLLMPCGIDIQDFPGGSKQAGLDYQDSSSNYTDERISVSADPSAARGFLTKLKGKIAGCKNYTDSSDQKPVSITANDPNWQVGDDAVYVNEVKGTVYLSWGYMRRGPVVVLISTITDIDQKSSIQQQLSRVADRITAAD
jgi:serine/threonine protein kinase